MAEHGHEEQVEGIKAQATGDKQWQKDYAKSDMEVVYRRTHPKSWDDLIHWLEQYGESDNELTPGERVAMKEDLTRLKQQGVAFTDNPHKASQEEHQHRRAEMSPHPGSAIPS